jgi:hypothetical protein
LSMSAVTSGRHRKWKNKWKTLNFLFLGECYTILLSSCFNCPKLLIPPDIEASTSGYLKKKFQILNFHCLKSLCFYSVWLQIKVDVLNVKILDKMVLKMSLSVMSYVWVEKTNILFSIFYVQMNRDFWNFKVLKTIDNPF